jgi:hypothetical protein
MKALKIVALVALFAVTGCKESSNVTMVATAHAKPMDVSVQYHYSGANIPASKARGQVYEYH